MGLVSCPECEKEVSSSAAACPHCGYVLNAAQNEPQRGRVEERVVYRKRRISFVSVVISVLVLALLVVVALWYVGVLRFV